MLSRTSTASSDTLPCPQLDADTIVVARPGRAQQLPTPSESSADFGSEKLLPGIDSSPNHRGGSHVTNASPSERIKEDDNASGKENTSNTTSRAVSGETLVSNTHQPSQSSILRNGISALNLPWSMSSLLTPEGEVDGSFPQQNKFPSLESLDQETVTVSPRKAPSEEKARVERAEKIRQNAEKRLAKIQNAESRATRRSSRAPVLEKAGDAISDLAANVLGKRTRDMVEKGKDVLGELTRRTSMRSRAAPTESTTPATSSLEGSNKKRRLDAEEEKVADKPKPAPRPKHKRFLNAGLYTGQSRHFDGRLTTSKNKHKALQQATPQDKENYVLPLPMFAGERLLNTGRDFRLPFGIFSPLPPGQPKPDEWRKVNRNVFVGDAGSIWRTHKFAEHSTCMCTPETGCDDDCQNRFMFYECDDRNCNLGAERCGNRSFAGLKERVKRGGKFNIGVEVIKTADRGHGVRSNRCFEPNQIIVEYTGEIITQEECEVRMSERYRDNECYYLMLFDQNMIIDATKGSIARFVNHSCEPNCRMEKWTVEGKPRMALFAGDAGIETGEELTYDYNFDPFSQKNVQECRCGSARCRGVLGPRPKEERKPKAAKENEKGHDKKKDEASDKCKGMLAGAKRRIAQALEGSNVVKKRRKAAFKTDSTRLRTKSNTSKASSSSKSPALSRNPSSSITVAQVERKPASTSQLRKMLRASSRNKTSRAQWYPKLSSEAAKNTDNIGDTHNDDNDDDQVNIDDIKVESEQLLRPPQADLESEQPLRRRDSVRTRATASVKKNFTKTDHDVMATPKALPVVDASGMIEEKEIDIEETIKLGEEIV